MSRIYVVEQMFVCANPDRQDSFAEKAAEKLRPLPGLWPEPTDKGLLVLASAELPLDTAAALLHAVYGDAVIPGPRRVCYLRQPRMEPVMDVFARVPPRHAEAVVDDLRARGATVRVSTGNRRGWLIWGEAPMAALLGYAGFLAAETGGRGHHRITVNRRGPVEPRRPPRHGTPARTGGGAALA